MEKKSRMDVIKAKPMMKAKCSVGGEHSRGGREPDWSVMAVVLIQLNNQLESFSSNVT